MTGVTHGGPDADARPQFDFSTNANSLGPSPLVLDAVRKADLTSYPDPAYTGLRRHLAEWHRRTPAEVVVGAGACELIHRAVRVAGGPVVVAEPTFGEYRYAADLAGAEVRSTRDPDSFLAALPGAAQAFLCVPNSPDGAVPETAWLAGAAHAAAAAGCHLVLDLAYYPLAQHQPELPTDAWQLWAPNKAHNLTGVRAAYLLAGVDDAARLARAPSWILSAPGEALLRATATAAASAWVLSNRVTLWQWRDDLVEGLAKIGVVALAGAANFLLASVENATATAVFLRQRDIRVRDATSFGLPERLRLSAQPPQAQVALLDALNELRAGEGSRPFGVGASRPVTAT
jgi:histidinol-phosphate aminotransferase